MKIQYLLIIPFLFLIFVGTRLVYLSLNTKQYIDENKFTEDYSKLNINDNEKFLKLKNKYKTNKYQNLDQGITIINLSLLLFISVFQKKALFNLISKIHSLIIGIFSVLLTVFSEIFVIYRDYKRGEFPHWADSIGIPIFWSILLGLVLFLWIFMNYFLTKMPKINIWFYSLSVFSFLLSVIYILEGSYLHICAIFFWILFYLSLTIRSNKIQKLNSI
ncbi:hypothetical protein CH366_18775 [Leptospira harrisiae]|nr:hypothetical protein CH366_18775 [Leptospira harrisiae]